MKKHTQDLKNNIKKMGRELDSIISYGNTELGNEELNSVTPVFESSLLKSVMKELDIDSKVDIPVGTVVNYKFGIAFNESEYEYLNYGKYIVYANEKQEDTNSYNLVCYDKMINSMVEYKGLKDNSKTFPMMFREYLTCLFEDIDIEFEDKDKKFANYDKMIPSDLYADLGYTYRDIFDEASQVVAGNIIINENDKAQIKYINETNDTINEEYLKNVNVKFGEKYGPINSIVLSRAAESDNVYLMDEKSVEENGLCEIKISENQIMNFNDRSDYLPDILEKLNGLEYYINNFSSTGICYYDVCDKYNVQVGDLTYTCVMFNDQVNITQGLEEFIYTDLPEQAETDYTKADKTDRKVNQAYIIANKQANQIEAVVSSTRQVSDSLNELEENVNNNTSAITQINETVQILQTSTSTQFNTINKTLEDGIEKVKNSLVTIDINGIKTSRDNENFYTQTTNKSYLIYDGSKPLVFIGYDDELKKTVARIPELEAKKITAGYHRCEAIIEDGEEITAWYFVGGGD